MSQENTVSELKTIAKSLGLKGYSTLRKSELIDLINSHQELALIPDITQNILSDYIEYEELKELEGKISDLKINPHRVKIEETFYDTGELESKKIFIDGDLRTVETFVEDGSPISIQNYEYGKLNGKQYNWYAGHKESEENYVNDKKEGTQYYYYYENSDILDTEVNYKNDEKEGQKISYDDNGQIYAISIYKNDKIISSKDLTDGVDNRQESIYDQYGYIKNQIFIKTEI